MTKNEVKQALQRGLGRGYLAVRNDPERYRDLVLWACGRNLAFDTQCEGTRAWYDYQLILCYNDRAEFRDHVIDRFQRKQPDGGWDYAHFSELLAYFAEDGDVAAEAALWEKYKELLAALHSFRRASRRMRNTIDCFESLCVALSWKEANYSRIALDVGGLFLKSRLYDGWDFEWLYDSRPKPFNQRLRKAADQSAELSAYLAAIDEHQRTMDGWKNTPRVTPIPESGRRLSGYLKRSAPELAPKYAEIYLAAEDPEVRAAALEAFVICPYPLDPSPVITDARSAHPALRSAALKALSEIRHPAVRDFAWALLANDPDNALPIAIKNYLPEDEARLYAMLQAYRVDYACKSNWHWLHWAIFDLFGKDSGVESPPKSLLPLVYETTLCSFCRETAARLMGRYRMMTPELWEEQLYDSNDDIRRAAQAHFRRTSCSGENDRHIRVPLKKN